MSAESNKKSIEIINEETTSEGKKIEFFIHNETRAFPDLLAETLRGKENVVSVACTVDHPVLDREDPKFFLQVKNGEPFDVLKEGLEELKERNQEWLEEIKRSLA